jgi:hypothetical protein
MAECRECLNVAAEMTATRGILERLEKAVIEHASEIAATRAIVEGMQKTLLGNGQPGVCAEHALRIARLERWRSWVAGALAALGVLWMAAVTIAAAILVEHFKR